MIKMRQVMFGPDGEPLATQGDVDVDASLAESGFTVLELRALMMAMPKQITGSGIITLFMNIMANYDMLPAWKMIIIQLATAISELKDEHPDYFKDGGIDRSREEMEKDFLKSRH